MHIVALGSAYKGKKIVFRYESDFYYEASYVETKNSFGVQFQKKTFKETVQKEFEDDLLGDYLENPLLFGVSYQNGITGYLELDHEQWNNRVRISSLFIEEKHRNKGMGRLLMQKAFDIAKELKARGVVLETQSCNYPAISLYRSCGLHFTGCDLTAYSNTDVEDHEVRLELVKIFE